MEAKSSTRIEYFRNRRRELKKTQEDVKNLNGELFVLCREQMVEIGSQRLLANGWTSYSLGDDVVDSLRREAEDVHAVALRENCTDESTSSIGYDYKLVDNDKVDAVIRSDGFIPRLLQRYFELSGGPRRDDVKNKCSSTCCHSKYHRSCHMENLYPLYCIVLVHLASGAGPLVYPKSRLGRSLSTPRSTMLSTSFASSHCELPPTILSELQERFGFITRSTPEALLCEMGGPGWREVGDVTIIASDMLYAMSPSLSQSINSCSNNSLNSSPSTSSKRAKTCSGQSSIGEFGERFKLVESVKPSCFQASDSSCYPHSTLYAYSIYQPKSEYNLSESYIPCVQESHNFRVDPVSLGKILSSSQESTDRNGSLLSDWSGFNMK